MQIPIREVLPDCSVVEAARFLRMSPRRVRALLAQKRLKGFKDADGYWRVRLPFKRAVGARGPKSRNV